MDRIEIELGMWESAPCPIYTKNVDTDEVEKRLYASAVRSYGKELVEDYVTNPAYREDGWTTEWEHFQEWLCAEEEALVMECGGIYYEDMETEVQCPYCNGELIIEGKNGLKKCLECGNEF